MEGKPVAVYYNDVPDRVSKVVGILIKKDKDFVEIRDGSNTIVIPREKIVRIETDPQYSGNSGRPMSQPYHG